MKLAPGEGIAIGKLQERNMDERPGSRLSQSFWTLMLASLLGFGFLFKSVPTGDLRPLQPPVVTSSRARGQNVPSRLWQDPLLVAQANWKETLQEYEKASNAKMRSVERQDPSLLHDAGRFWDALADVRPMPRTLDVLAVFLQGDIYASQSESRLQSRFAVLSALAYHGFLPVNPDHIGYACRAETESLNIVPFEIFQRTSSAGTGSDSETSAVAVLWINESEIGIRPLRALDDILAWLSRPVALPCAPVRPIDRVDLLGPTSSDRLRHILEELAESRESSPARAAPREAAPAPDSLARAPAKRGPAETGGNDLQLASVMSRSPTSETHKPSPARTRGRFGISFAESAETIAPPDRQPGWKESRVWPWGDLRIYASEPTVPTRLLIDEKKLIGCCRKAHLRSADGHWLCGEDPCDFGDDRYLDFGEARVHLHRTTTMDSELAVEIVRELRRRNCDPSDPDQDIVMLAEYDSHYSRAWRQNFRDALATLDGRPKGLADDSPSNFRFYAFLRGLDGVVPDDKTAGAKPADRLRFGSGVSQFDYAQRLANEIHRRDTQRSVCAVGIVAGDVYDKLLLLRAFRPVFPKAIFFTMDLDTRLWTEDDVAFTRNMIVASHFGLTLNERRQAGRPPFRNSYQTAEYYAALLALSGTSATPGLRNLKPRLFEIGRTGARDISVGISDLGSETVPSLREGRLPFGFRQWTITLFVITLAYGLVMTLSTAVRCGSRKLLRGVLHVGWVRFLTGLVAALLVAMTVSVLSDDGEPFSIALGISVWPTVLFQLLATVCGIRFLARSIETVRGVDERVRTLCEFGHEHGPPPVLPPTGVRATPSFIAGVRSDLQRFVGFVKEIVRELRRSPAYENPVRAPAETDFGREPLAVGEKCLCEYLESAQPRKRILRTCGYTVIYVAAGFLLIALMGMPNKPARGALALTVLRFTIFSSVAVTHLLLFYVFDALWHARRSIRDVRNSAWTESTRRALGVTSHSDDRLVTLTVAQLVGARVERLIYLPFVCLLLMLVARTHVFDAFDWPWTLVVVIGSSFLLLVAAAAGLKIAAHQLRNGVLRSVDDEIYRLESLPVEPVARKGAPSPVVRLDALKRRVETLRSGLFAMLVGDPLVHAVLIPFSGIGTINMLENVFQRL